MLEGDVTNCFFVFFLVFLSRGLDLLLACVGARRYEWGLWFCVFFVFFFVFSKKYYVINCYHSTIGVLL